MKAKVECTLKPVDNEKGFVLVVALVMLVTLTMLGLYASSNTTTELLISGNERVADDVFYVAESGWIRGFQWIENWGTSSAPPLINGVNASTTLPLVAQVTGQSLGSATYSYTIGRTSIPIKSAGNSKAYLNFLYTITSNATGMNSAARSVTVGVSKISK